MKIPSKDEIRNGLETLVLAQSPVLPVLYGAARIFYSFRHGIDNKREILNKVVISLSIWSAIAGAVQIKDDIFQERVSTYYEVETDDFTISGSYVNTLDHSDLDNLLIPVLYPLLTERPYRPESREIIFLESEYSERLGRTIVTSRDYCPRMYARSENGNVVFRLRDESEKGIAPKIVENCYTISDSYPPVSIGTKLED